MADYVSDRLKALSRRLKEARHGGLVLTGEELEAFIRTIDALADDSRQIENAYSRAEWNRRALRDREQQAVRSARVRAGVQIPGSNVALFPVAPRRAPDPDGGGHVA